MFGINTARSLTIKNGRVNEEQIARVRARLCALGDHITKIIVTHHPFDLPERYDDRNLVRRAPIAMDMFSSCRADLLLAGNLHASHARNTSARYNIGGYLALVVQAGTATSTRGRGESNSFNIIRIASPRIVIERFSWMPDRGAFAHAVTETFERVSNGWASLKHVSQ